jgi:ribosomal protein S18 acetylase RimI-like enzyme
MVDMSDLKVRKVTIGDSSEILRWRNNPETVQFSLSKKYVTQQEHEIWFHKKLDSLTNFMYVGTIDQLLVGVVNFSHTEDKLIFKLSINVAPETRSIGFGFKLLNLAEKELNHEIGSCTLSAIVLKHNLRSLSFFRKCNYELYTETKKIIEFRKNLD